MIRVEALRLDEHDPASLCARRTAAGRTLLSRMTRALFGREPGELTFNENGKPLCALCWFSISHTDGLAVCAVSDRPVGIDVEPIRPLKRRTRYPLFSAAECAYVNAGADHESRFLTLWTRKEALIKMRGGRLADAAKTDLVDRDGTLLSALPDCFFETERLDGYILSVCRACPERALEKAILRENN